MKQFWMVYVEGGGNPTHQHSSEVLARAESARLARATGKKAYLLQAIACCQYQPVVWDEVRSTDERPF